MFSRQRLKLFFISLDGTTVGTAILLFILAGLLFFRLSSLVPAFSPAEKYWLAQSSSLHAILKNPINAPFKMAEYTFKYLHHLDLLISRVVAVLFAILALGLFYYVAKNWHGHKVALMATVLFGTSSWFLHYGRSATPDILLTLSLVALTYGAWVRKTNRSALAILLGVVIAGALMYVPGLCLLAILGLAWQRKAVAEHVKNAKLSFAPLAVVGIVMLVPLGWALSRQPSLIKDLVGLPSKIPNPYDYFRHVANVPYQLFVKRPPDPVNWLGKLPLLDLFTSVMVLLGAYTYRQLKLDRAKILAGLLVIGTLLAGLRGTVTIVIILPAIYFLAAAGLDYMLKEWTRVYPRNPLARTLGYSLIIIGVGLVTYYNLRSYFVAWPQAPATKRAYQLRQ